MQTFLDFETRIAELAGKIAELKSINDEDGSVSIADEVKQLESKLSKSLADLYADLEPWQKTQVARHPDRPHTKDYLDALISEFTPLAGDRKYAEDDAVIGGLGRFEGNPVLVIGQEKGADTKSRLETQFRHGAAGRLSQGCAADGAGRALQPAGADICGYCRRLSRHRCGGTRPGRGDRAVDGLLPGARLTDRLDDYR